MPNDPWLPPVVHPEPLPRHGVKPLSRLRLHANTPSSHPRNARNLPAPAVALDAGSRGIWPRSALEAIDKSTLWNPLPLRLLLPLLPLRTLPPLRPRLITLRIFDSVS